MTADILLVTLAGTAIPLLIKLARKNRRQEQVVKATAQSAKTNDDDQNINHDYIYLGWLDVNVLINFCVSEHGQMSISIRGNKSDQTGVYPLTLAELQTIIRLAEDYVNSPQAEADWIQWAMGKYQGPDPDANRERGDGQDE